MDLPRETTEKAVRLACAEARKWVGATSPNPPVGAAALDRNGELLAVAAHKHAGEAHAEALLLEICNAHNLLPRVHAIAVTLEPCNHHGRTPPCTEAIINSGIKRVIIGARDPNPVAGGGAERLRAAGVEVLEGVAENECRQTIHAFAYSTATGRPWVTVKRVFDEGGSMIPPAGAKTFASTASLRLAHRLRKKTDAILTGSGTVLTDNPLFTVRHVADHPGKRRWLAILDRRKRVPKDYLEAAAARGLDAVIYENIEAALSDLAAKGARDVLVEAGPALSQAVLATKLWCMEVSIHKAAPQDRIEVGFSDIPLPFTTEGFNGGYFLPNED